MPWPNSVPKSASTRCSGSTQKNCRSHLKYRMWIGSPRPSASRILWRTSSGMVSGICAIGSPGASSSSRNRIRLMRISVGIAVNNRRKVKVSIGTDPGMERGCGSGADAAPPCQ